MTDIRPFAKPSLVLCLVGAVEMGVLPGSFAAQPPAKHEQDTVEVSPKLSIALNRLLELTSGGQRRLPFMHATEEVQLRDKQHAEFDEELDSLAELLPVGKETSETLLFDEQTIEFHLMKIDRDRRHQRELYENILTKYGDPKEPWEGIGRPKVPTRNRVETVKRSQLFVWEYMLLAPRSRRMKFMCKTNEPLRALAMIGDDICVPVIAYRFRMGLAGVVTGGRTIDLRHRQEEIKTILSFRTLRSLEVAMNCLSFLELAVPASGHNIGRVDRVQYWRTLSPNANAMGAIDLEEFRDIVREALSSDSNVTPSGRSRSWKPVLATYPIEDLRAEDRRLIVDAIATGNE